jgi:bifunctional oligoribonuclease and PAP phosphatase NrnA
LKFNNIEIVRDLLENKNQKIIIVSHVNPDGDAVGSTLGFYHFLKKDNYTDVSLILPGNFPSFLAWLPSSSEIIIADKEPETAKTNLLEANIIFCLDFNDPARAGNLADTLIASKAIRILIDHHPNPLKQFNYMFSDTNVSSTAELVYEFIVSLNKQNILDLNIAECLYTGIITDTGSFSFACNYPSTYYITALFIEMGLDGELIHRKIYDTYSEDRMRLLGYCLSKKLVVMQDHNTAYISLSADDLSRFNYAEGDTEGVVNYALGVKGVKLAAFFTERSDQIKISFRSEGEINVNVLARKYFKGGGHKNASGGNSKDNLPVTIDKFEKVIAEVSANDFEVLKLNDDND